MICNLRPEQSTFTCSPSEIVDELRREGTASVDGLAQRLGLEPADVRRALQQWVARGQVELLRPCGHHAVADDELDYYRWRLPSDRDCLWEQDCLREDVWPEVLAHFVSGAGGGAVRTRGSLNRAGW